MITMSWYDAVTFDLIRPFGPPSPPGEGYFSHRRFGVWNLSGRGMPPPLQCLAVSVSHFAHAKIKPAGKKFPLRAFHYVRGAFLLQKAQAADDGRLLGLTGADL